MIPAFPTFKYITADDREEVEKYTGECAKYSDYNFVSLFGWDTGGERMLSLLNGNLVVKFTDYTTHDPFLSFVGTHKVEETARILLEYARDTGIEVVLKLLPEETARLITAPEFCITEDRSNFDYVYHIPTLTDPHDARTKKVRAQMERFMNIHTDARCDITHKLSPDMRDSVCATLAKWEEKKRTSNPSFVSTHEEAAIHRLFEESSWHDILLTGVYVDKTLCAFSIDDISGSSAMSHFYKADTTYTGIYDYMNYKIAYHLETLGITKWNWQQDLGLDALRRAKLKYPVDHYLKKYTGTLRTG